MVVLDFAEQHANCFISWHVRRNPAASQNLLAAFRITGRGFGALEEVRPLVMLSHSFWFLGLIRIFIRWGSLWSFRGVVGDSGTFADLCLLMVMAVLTAVLGS